jgi:hypothetical protein
VLIFTRFSIRDPSCGAWRKSADSVFSPARLEAKMQCFERMTAPSIGRQSGAPAARIEWLLFTSPDLPQPYMARLRAAADRCERDMRRAGAVSAQSRVRVEEVAAMSELYARCKQQVNMMRTSGSGPFATVRLDDDDALSANYMQRLMRYRTARPGLVVSFPRGRKYAFDSSGRVRQGQPMNRKLIALGLARIGDNIQACGRHTQIATKYAVVYDETPGMYLCYCGEHTDTRRAFRA